MLRQVPYLSPADADRFFVCAVAAPANLLGFQPRDTWPQGVEEWLPRT